MRIKKIMPKNDEAFQYCAKKLRMYTEVTEGIKYGISVLLTFTFALCEYFIMDKLNISVNLVSSKSISTTYPQHVLFLYVPIFNFGNS